LRANKAGKTSTFLLDLRIGLEVFLFGEYGLASVARREFIPSLVEGIVNTGLNVAIYGFMAVLIGFRAPEYFSYFLISFILARIGDVGRHVISNIQSYGRKIRSWVHPTKHGTGFLYIFYVLSYEYQAFISIVTALAVASLFGVDLPFFPHAIPMVSAALFCYVAFTALMQALAERAGVKVVARRIFFIRTYQVFNSFIAGVYFPITLFPEPLHTLSRLYPITNALSYARNAATYGAIDGMVLMVLAVAGIIFLLLTKRVMDSIWKIVREHDLWTYYVRYA